MVCILYLLCLDCCVRSITKLKVVMFLYLYIKGEISLAAAATIDIYCTALFTERVSSITRHFFLPIIIDQLFLPHVGTSTSACPSSGASVCCKAGQS